MIHSFEPKGHLRGTYNGEKDCHAGHMFGFGYWERTMSSRTANAKTADAATEEPVQMYPGNELKPQARKFSETISVFRVLRDAFFGEKDKETAAKA